jgi:hypothetical protein
MSVSQSTSVTTILREHVTLEVESIDRMYLNVYVPLLQRAAGVVGFFRHHHLHQANPAKEGSRRS